MKISQAKALIKTIVENNVALQAANNNDYLVPYLVSIPGLGKSTIIKDVAEELGIENRVVILAQFDAGELGGFPVVDKENDTYYRAKPFFMPTEGKGILFLDELPQAPVSNQNIAAQLVLERRIGEHQLPDGWVVVCAGNPLSSRAGTNAMPSHLKDRLMPLEVEPDASSFREYALSKGFLPEVTSFINERPEWLSKFDPKSDASPSPRSWEKVNSVLKLGLDSSLEYFALKGTIGEGAVTDFLGYLRVWKDLPKIEEVLADPENHSIPESPSVLYALCSSLAHHTNKSNLRATIKYISRFPNKEFTAFCVKDLLARNPKLKAEKAIVDWFMSQGRELML